MTDKNGQEVRIGDMVYWRFMRVVNPDNSFCVRGFGKIISFDKDEWFIDQDVAIVRRYELDNHDGPTIPKLSEDIIKFTPEEAMLWKLENA